MNNYDDYYNLETESGSIGLISCLRCGAVIILNKETDFKNVHDKWHETVR